MLNPYIEAWQLRDLIAKKEVKLSEVAEFFNRRIERLNPKLGAYMSPTPERALADAARLEKAGAAEIARMPLYGIPYSLKDLTWTKDIKTTMGSRNYENYLPPVDAETTIRMRNAGGILLGKTATPEFGGRPTTEGGYVLPRAIRGTSSTPPAGRAAARHALRRRDSDRWRKEATAAARFASPRVAAEPWG